MVLASSLIWAKNWSVWKIFFLLQEKEQINDLLKFGWFVWYQVLYIYIYIERERERLYRFKGTIDVVKESENPKALMYVPPRAYFKSFVGYGGISTIFDCSTARLSIEFSIYDRGHVRAHTDWSFCGMQMLILSLANQYKVHKSVCFLDRTRRCYPQIRNNGRASHVGWS
jgi:hypothetical protein